jgi:membrane protease YdiL (CAAX protease family)
MQLIKSTTKNWLLKSAGLSLCLAIYVLIIYHDTINNSRSVYNNSLLTFILTALIIAPISEELIFRIHFLKKFKFLKYLSLIIIALIIFFKSNPLLIILFLIYVFLYLIIELKFTEKNILINTLYILNSLIFSLLHYKFNDFNFIETYGFIFFQFSLSMFAIWITLNFSLVKSIIFHMIWNLLPVLFLLFSLTFPFKEKKQIMSKNYIITYSKESILKKDKIFTNDKSNITAKNMSLKELFFFLNKESKDKYYQNEPFIKYNISITSKRKDVKIDYVEIEELFLNNNLIGIME